jgi:uncharacterized protein (DUF2336 family)
MRRVRGPFSEKQQQVLAAVLGRFCGRALILEDRVRALELALEKKGLSTQARIAFREDAVAERHLEGLCFPDQGSVHRDLAEILAGKSLDA